MHRIIETDFGPLKVPDVYVPRGEWDDFVAREKAKAKDAWDKGDA